LLFGTLRRLAVPITLIVLMSTMCTFPAVQKIGSNDALGSFFRAVPAAVRALEHLELYDVSLMTFYPRIS